MKNNFYTKYRKFIFIALYLLILPLILIPAIYISTYVSNRPQIFSNNDSDEETIDLEILNPNQLSNFKLDVFAVEYKKALSSVNAGHIYLDAKITDIQENIYNVSLFFELNTNWQDNHVVGSGSRVFNNGQMLVSGEEYNIPYEFNFANITTVYPIKVMPFVWLNAPDLYVKVSWEEKVFKLGEYEMQEKSVIVCYTYDMYINSETKVI